LLIYLPIIFIYLKQAKRLAIFYTRIITDLKQSLVLVYILSKTRLICFLKIYIMKQRVSSGIFVFLKEAKLPFDRLTKSKIICFIQCLKQAKFPSKSLTRISVFLKRAVRGAHIKI
jgi:hypothetical protein